MKLTVCMATFDDYDGVFFTVQSLRMQNMALPLAEQWLHEVIVMDNNPTSPHGEALRKFAAEIPHLMRVMPVTDRVGSFIKYDAIKQATGDVVLGLDCHVLLFDGFLPALRRWWADHQEQPHLVSGPVVYHNLRSFSTHMEPEWRGHDFGTWATNNAGVAAGVAFEIPMQGMGCWSVWRTAWPGVPRDLFSGFGAEEWYCAELTRQAGGKVFCHPSMRWMHRFSWPKRSFPLTLEDKVLNYYRGWLSLYGSLDAEPMAAMTAHWKTIVPAARLEEWIARAPIDITTPAIIADRGSLHRS